MTDELKPRNCKTFEQEIEEALAFREAYLKAYPHIKLLSMKDSTAMWRAEQNNIEALKAENERLRELKAFFENKIYILERAPKDELSDRYRVEVTKLKQALEGK